MKCVINDPLVIKQLITKKYYNKKEDQLYLSEMSIKNAKRTSIKVQFFK